MIIIRQAAVQSARSLSSDSPLESSSTLSRWSAVAVAVLLLGWAMGGQEPQSSTTWTMASSAADTQPTAGRHRLMLDTSGAGKDK